METCCDPLVHCLVPMFTVHGLSTTHNRHLPNGSFDLLNESFDLLNESFDLLNESFDLLILIYLCAFIFFSVTLVDSWINFFFNL